MKPDKKQIIHILKEMAILMEIQGENPFKVRAYENAARALDALPEEMDELIESGKIKEVKGIGSGIMEKIMTLYQTRRLPVYEDLKAKIPASLLEMLHIPGMGPKKIKAVWEKLNITTIEALETACLEERLADLDGFGARTQEKIMKGIEMFKKFRERHLISEILAEAIPIYNTLKEFHGVIRIQTAGSLRRWKETVKDIDMLVSAGEEHRMAIMDHFTSLPGVETLVAKGETKSSIALMSGINADLRIVSDSQFPYALHHFTGSKEHNIAMREYANKLGLKMNEYGLFRGEENIPCVDEEDIFKNLGMDYIPPELRENTGEIEAALAHRLPELVMQKDIRGMLHVHTHYSDGVNSIAEMANACRERGYEYLLICDHSKSSYIANGLNEERLQQQQAEIEELNKQSGDFRILKGIECDILPDGRLDFSNEILKTFDAVVASVHSKFNMTEEEATQRIIRAMENPYVTILGHPTGRLLLEREGYPLNQYKIIDAAAELGVAIELNAHPYRLDMDWRYLKYAKEKGVLISINPDAHRIDGFEDMLFGIGIARKGWLSKDDVLNTRSCDEFLKFARMRRK